MEADLNITCQACFKPFTTECILQDHEDFFRSQPSDHSQDDLNPGTQDEYENINANQGLFLDTFLTNQLNWSWQFLSFSEILFGFFFQNLA